MTARNILSIALLSGWALILGTLIYKTYFEKHFLAQSVITEIETLKIDSVKEYSTSSEAVYQFWVGGKYKVNLIRTISKPFTQKANDEVYIMNYEGEMVMLYNTKYHYVLFDAWKSDYIRLMKYLNIMSKGV